MSYEETLINKIKAATNNIRNKTKSPAEAGAGVFFKRLKEINEPMYDELMNNYRAALNIYNSETSNLK